MMEYKGYLGRVEYDDEAKLFHGKVFGLNDVITFQGTTVEDLEKAFKDSIDDYLEFCRERGEAPEKPYSGKFNLRLSSEMHARVAFEAKKHNQSINSYVADLIEKAVERDSGRGFFDSSSPPKNHQKRL